WPTTHGRNGTITILAIARDLAGNQRISAPVIVTVNNPDVLAPRVGITAPVNGGVLLGSVTLRANAQDNVAVTGVTFFVDGIGQGTEDTLAPYELIWETLSINNGPHLIMAIARDAVGNETSSDAVTVTVSNPDTTG